MKLSDLIERSPDGEVLRLWLERIPYARFLGIEASITGGDVLFKLPAQPMLVGNPTLPAIHGGVVGAFLELAATFHLLAKMEQPVLPKTINFSLDYLRPTRVQDTFARCSVSRQGRSIANVAVAAYQDDPNTSTATARVHFLLADYD